MQRAEFVHLLDTFLQSDGFTDACPNGMQLEGREDIRKVAFGVTASLDLIERSVKAGVDALVVHHGLFWKGDSFVIDRAKRKKLALLLGNEINLLAYHLPLDAHQEVGNNWGAARDLSLFDLRPFGNYQGCFVGVRGEIAPISSDAFASRLEEYYRQKPTVAYSSKGMIRKVAICSGGAHRLLDEAVRSGVDAFVTGSFDLPVWHMAREENIHFYAVGHASSERIGPQKIMNYVAKNFPCETIWLDEENPF